MIKHKKAYKPLLFTTTVRNPARLKRYLYILSKYTGQILTDSLAETICGEAMRYGLYRPINKTESIKEKWPHSSMGDFAEELLSKQEVDWLLSHNPQKHKEAGFGYGWPSRFATIFDIVKQFGFAYFKIGEAIEISELGCRLVQNLSVEEKDGLLSVSDINPQVDNDAFMHAMVKYHRDNPFLRVLNSNTPLVLLLKVIKLLNADTRFNGCGISRRELPLLIFWKDDDAHAAYEMIVELRLKYNYNPSSEVIRDYCVDKILGGEFKKFKLESIVNEYPDEYIRKMRYTGLISLRGAGRFVDINSNESARVEYILEHYSEYKTYSDEREYWKYVSKIDEKLLRCAVTKPNTDKKEQLLAKWVNEYPWNVVKNELLLLATEHGSSDPVLRFLDVPIRLEFLIALAVKERKAIYRVRPNYSCDDEGLPTSTAGGNLPDIECYGSNNVIIEVTMSKGRQQVVMEGWPVGRHLEAFEQEHGQASCAFVAPTLFQDTISQFEWQFERKGLYIKAFTIKDFISELEDSPGALAPIPV